MSSDDSDVYHAGPYSLPKFQASGPAPATRKSPAEIRTDYATFTTGSHMIPTWQTPGCKTRETKAIPLLKPYLENSKPYIRNGEPTITAYDTHSSCTEIMDDILSFYFEGPSFDRYKGKIDELKSKDEYKTFEYFLHILRDFPISETGKRNGVMTTEAWLEWHDLVSRQVEDDNLLNSKTRKSRNLTVLLDSYVNAQTLDNDVDAADEELRSAMRALLDFLDVDYRINDEVKLSMNAKVNNQEKCDSKSKPRRHQQMSEQTISFHSNPDIIVISEWCKKVCYALVIDICSERLRKKDITMAVSNSVQSSDSSKDQEIERRSGSSNFMRSQDQKSSHKRQSRSQISSHRMKSPGQKSSPQMQGQGQRLSQQHPLGLVCSAYQTDELLRRKPLLFRGLEMTDPVQEGISLTCSEHLTMPGILLLRDKVLLTKMVCERYDLSQHERSADYRFSRSNQYVINDKYLTLHHHWKQLAQLLMLFSQSVPIIDHRIRTTS